MYMDPLSITASVLGILGAVQQANKGVGKLRSLKHANQDFSFLLNELADLEIVLTQVNSLSQDLDARAPDGPAGALKSHLKRASAQLLELNELVAYNLSKPEPETGGGYKVDRVGWLRNEQKILASQKNLLTTRWNISTAIGLVSS